MKTNIIGLLAIMFLSSCKPEGNNVVNAILSKITEPVSISVSPGTDLGEILVSDEPLKIEITITNNSSNAINSLEYKVDLSQNLINYVPDSKGIVEYPGKNGTCTTTLAPGASCKIKLNLYTRKNGEFSVPGKISYTNLIDKQERDVNFTFVAGDPAALSFTAGKTTYSMGTLDLSDSTIRTETYEVKNIGGLSARNLEITMGGDAGFGEAFNIVNHNCPTNLKIGKKCQVIIQYNAVNKAAIDDADEEEMYSANLNFKYSKDPNDNFGFLNGYYSLTSTRIQARFKSSLDSIDFGEVITGNRTTKTIKFSNRGYNKGTFKSFTIKNTNDSNKEFQCVFDSLSTNPQILSCKQSGANVTIAQFPFIVEDLSSCFNKEVNFLGGPPENGSADCLLRFTYQPSIKYNPANRFNDENDFNNATLSINYDSFWKNQAGTYVTKNDVYTFNNTFKLKGSLIVDKISFGAINYAIGSGLNSPPGKNNDNENFYDVNFGRLPLVIDPSIYDQISITIKNEGETAAQFVSLKDYKNSFSILSTDSNKTDARDINTYYKGLDIDDTCTDSITAGSSCVITVRLHLLKQSTTLADINQMFDHYSGTPAAESQIGRFKRFIYTYSDRGALNDNGDVLTERSINIDLSALLVTKARLIATPSPSNMGNIVIGNTKDLTFTIKNVGTGTATDLTYNSLIPTNNFEPLKLKDYTKFSDSCTVNPNSNDLPSNTLCAIVVRFDNKVEIKNDVIAANDYEAYNQSLYNPTAGSFKLDLNYGDGDCTLSDPTTCPKDDSGSYNIGSTANITVNPVAYNFITPAMLAFRSITGFPGLILYRSKETIDAIDNTFDYIRPPRFYTARNFMPAVSGKTLNADAAVKSSSCSISAPVSTDDFNSSYIFRDLSLCQFFNLQFHNNDTYPSHNFQILHLGRFSKNQSWSGSFDLNKIGSDRFSDLTITEVDGSLWGQNPASFVSLKKHIKITSLNSTSVVEGASLFNRSGIAGTNLSFNINVNYANDSTIDAPAYASIRCFEIKYKSESITTEATNARWFNFCLSADFIDFPPKFQVTSLAHDTEWNGTSFSYTPTTSTVFNLDKVNDFNSSPAVTLETVSGQLIAGNNSTYNNDFKKITIKNTSGLDIPNLKILFIKGFPIPNDVVLASELTSQGLVLQNNNCPTFLANGDECSFEIKYSPFTITSKTDWNILISSLDSSKNHYQHIIKLILYGGSANKAIAVGRSAETSVYKDFSVTPAITPRSGVYKISLSSFVPQSTNTHYQIGVNAKNTWILDLTSSSTQIISLLKQNATPVFTSGWAPLNTAGNITAEANQGCFYGDIGSGSPSTAGFSTSTSLGNRCQIRLTFNPDIKYNSTSCNNTGFTSLTNGALNTGGVVPGKNIGGKLSSLCSDNFIGLNYWSYKRKTFDTIYFYFDGDVESPRVSSSTLTSYNPTINTYLTAITSTSKAEVSFPLPTLNNTETSSLGNIASDITNFVILYTKSSNLSTLKTSNIFDPSTYAANGISSITLPSTDTSVTLTNLDRNTYYFFKILLKLNKPSSKTNWPSSYYADFNGSKVFSILTPPDQNYFYASDLGSFTDRRLRNSSIMSFTNAKSNCTSSYFSPINFPAIAQRSYSRLINVNEFAKIRAGTTPSILQSNSTVYNPGYSPHWVNDTLVNISSATMQLYNGTTLPGGFPGYDSTQTGIYNQSYGVGYIKTCNSTSCPNLALMMGLFDELPEVSYYLPDSASYTLGYPRCATTVKCPFNFSISIKDTNCK